MRGAAGVPELVVPDATEDVPVADGLSLHVRRWTGGAGTPVLLVHGLASNARLWDGVAVALAGSGHPVAAVDLRGHGRSDRPDGGYDIPTVADDLAALIDALGWHRPVVAGQSWGGNVVLELIARRPDVAAAAALVDGGTIDLRRRFPRWEQCAEALRPPELEGTPLAEIERRLRDAHPDWPETGIRGQLGCFDVRADGTVAPWLTLERHLLALRGLWEHRPTERYGDVQVPVLLLAAGPDAEDEAARAEAVAELDAAAAAMGDARVTWMRGDHDLHAQHPIEVAALLADLAGGAEPS